MTQVTAENSFAEPARGMLERSTSDHTTGELLQMLFTGDVVDLPHIAQLIDRGQIASAARQPDELASLVELPYPIVKVIAASLEIARRASIGCAEPAIRGPGDVAAIARRDIGGRTRECVLVLVCDAANVILKAVIAAQGSDDGAPVPVRAILNAVLRHDGRAFAIAHNHPGGRLEPSDADMAATERLAAAARAVGLRFLGHVIVGQGASYVAVPNSRLRVA